MCHVPRACGVDRQKHFREQSRSSVRQFEREDPIGARVWSLDAVIALGDHDDQEDP